MSTQPRAVPTGASAEGGAPGPTLRRVDKPMAAAGERPSKTTAPRPRRIRIPLLLNLVVVDDSDQIAELNRHADVSRVIGTTGGLVHRLIARRIYRTLSVNGEPLPAFTARTDENRARRQRALEAKLAAVSTSAMPYRVAVAALARYVAGGSSQIEVGVAVQQLVGQLLVPDYRATPETYAAAKLMASWPRANPIAAFWWRWTGQLERSRSLLWNGARQDPVAVHGTALAIHNIVDSLERMRVLATAVGPRGLAANAVAQSLVAPSAVLRSCVKETRVSFLDEPLPRGTLILFRLERAHGGTANNSRAFMEGEWDACPAHAFIPTLLEDVWETAASRWPISQRSWGPSAEGGVLGRAFWGAYEGTFTLLNRVRPWYRLPTWLAVMNLLALRNVLRRKNLYDTEAPAPQGSPAGPLPAAEICARTTDGRLNDLASPRMGCAGARFGRNMARDRTHPNVERLLVPSPRVVSQRLLRRERFVPATSLNLLAAAWIQFQVHDWFGHQTSDTEYFDLPLEKDDTWFEDPMRIRRTVVDRNAADPPGAPPAYANSQSHWWDASQLYGTTQAVQRSIRSDQDGKLRVLENGLLPYDLSTGIEVTGFNDNWWLGLSLVHTLFTLEHNAICDRLRSAYPSWDADRVFSVARLINAALIAKIHTVEWTPAILAHPALKIGMNANWWGLAGERLTRMLGRFGKSETISGIPGSPTDHHAAPYALTEEFVSVYRMHPLMPDDFHFYALADGRSLGTLGLTEVSGRNTRRVLDGFTMRDLFYTFGVTHPGAVVLHNYPRSLQDLEKLNGDRLDLASTEIFRDRERGVPRYNEFRRLLHMEPARSFEALTPNREWAEEIREVYGNDIESVDLMVGMYAETPPPGFGFSDTAFRIFILMASRRLKSDRFFTSDFRPEIYTPEGLQWVQTNDMRTVMMRHYPELGPALRLVDNAFAPWRAS